MLLYLAQCILMLVFYKKEILTFFSCLETCSGASSPPPISSVPQMSKVSKSFGCGYPPLQPGYQNVTPSLPSPAMQPSNSGYNSGFSQYPQVRNPKNLISMMKLARNKLNKKECFIMHN